MENDFLDLSEDFLYSRNDNSDRSEKSRDKVHSYKEI